MTTIEPAQPPGPYITYGPVGMSVHTAQVRLLLTIHLVTALSYLGNSGVPHAQVCHRTCPGGNATLCGNQLRFSAGDGCHRDHFGTAERGERRCVAQVNKALMTNFTAGILKHSGDAGFQACGAAEHYRSRGDRGGRSSATNLTFTQQQMQATPPAGEADRTSTDMSTSVIDSIGSSLTLSVNAAKSLLRCVTALCQLMTLLARRWPRSSTRWSTRSSPRSA